jgi:hypothetical protein
MNAQNPVHVSGPQNGLQFSGEFKIPQPPTTITYIAKPQDKRCNWWSVQLPDSGLELDGERLAAPYLKNGADLELAPGQMIIDSEAMHHRRERGYRVLLIVALNSGEWRVLNPTAARKAYIKAHGGRDLMRESGDVNGCIRMAVWLRRQPDLDAAFAEIEAA